MKTSHKLAAVFVPLAALVAWIVMDGEERDALLTAKGTAIVTGVTLLEDMESRSLDTTEFEVLLSADGREVSTKATLPGNRLEEFRKGHTFTVCYDPQDPTELDIELDPAATCGA